jgi:hypothetical protein
MYRVLTTQPVLRVGLGYRRDDTRFTSPLYYTPQDFNALSFWPTTLTIVAVCATGLTAGYPISGRGDDGDNRPAKTLFGYVDYEASDIVTLFSMAALSMRRTLNRVTSRWADVVLLKSGGVRQVRMEGHEHQSRD